MSQVVNNTDKLTFILTSYGLGRVAEALMDKEVTVMLSKIKVGDANFEYYIPKETAEDLKHPIEDGEFYIIEKDLLEDKLTISLRALIPENFCDCEIREVGIYETVNGEDKLFAISTQQPLLKPSTDLHYYIAVDYFAFLKAANLAEIYEQIILDPDTQAVTKEDFENLMMSIAFTEGNLMEQINGNSRVIGLNRAQQLAELIEASKRNLTSISSLNLYTLLTNFCEPEDIYAYWLFDYARKSSKITSVPDISPHGRDLNTSKANSLFERVSYGLTNLLKFTKNDYFTLPQSDSISKFNKYEFTYNGAIEVNAIGKAFSFSRSNYVTLPSIPLDPEKTYSIIFDFCLDNITNSQVIVSSASSYVMLCYYDNVSQTLTAKLGDGMQWQTQLTFEVEPNQEYTCKLKFNGSKCSLQVMEYGTFVEKSYAPINYNTPINLGTILIGAPVGDFDPFSGYMYLTKFSVTENDKRIYSGSTYVEVNNLSFVSADGIEDEPFAMFYVAEPSEVGVDRTIMARANYSTETKIFEFIETANNALKITFYEDLDNYVVFTSAPNSIPVKEHVVGINYHSDTKTLVAFVDGKRVDFNKEIYGIYNHMNNDDSASLYAFTYTDRYEIFTNSETNPTSLYNADGTAYTGSDWVCVNNKVYYEGNEASYLRNDYTDTLYCWYFNDGLEEFKIYTKTLNIEENTVLYNDDFTVYEGEDYKVEYVMEEEVGTYKVTYLNQEMTYRAASSILPKLRCCFEYAFPTKLIWANNPEVPSVLYDEDGEVYTGTEWYIDDYTVYYQNGSAAERDSFYDIISPSIPLTSYIVDEEGKIIKPINSSIGLLCIVQEAVSDRNVSALVMNLDANIGHNPCIKER